MNPAQPKNPHSVGDRVKHEKHGTGTVVEAMAGGSTLVLFDKGNRGNFPSGSTHLKPSDTEVPANHDPANILERLKRLNKRYGGEIHKTSPVGGYASIYRATVEGEQVTIGIGDDGEPYTYTLKGGRKPLAEPAELVWVNPAHWHGEPIPIRQWYVPDMIPMRQVTLLTGDGGVGKSLLAAQIGAAGAMCVETLGLEPWGGKVIYLGAEDEADEFHRRLADIAKALGGDLSDLHLFRLLPAADMDALLAAPDKQGVMQPTALWLDFADFAENYEPKLIVLDTSADLFGGDEIKRSQVRQFISMLRKLAIKINCAIVLLSHPSVAGMQTGTGTSGSTAWSNSVRARLYLTADKDDDNLRTLKGMKANYAAKGGELKLRWHEGAFVLDDGKPSPAAGLLANHADKVFLRLLSAINGSGQNVSPNRSSSYAPTVMAKRPDRDGLSKKALEEAMHRSLAAGTAAVVTEGSPSRQRQRLVVVADEVKQGRTALLPTVPSNGLPTPSNGAAHTPPITPVGVGNARPLEDGRQYQANNDYSEPAREAA